MAGPPVRRGGDPGSCTLDMTWKRGDAVSAAAREEHSAARALVPVYSQ